MFKFIEFFVTVFYIGKIKYCPGTCGSLVAFLLCYLTMYFTISSQFIFPFSHFTISEAQIITLFIIAFTICLWLLIFGIYIVNIYLKTSKTKDPAEVVIDEVVGQMLTVILSFFSVIFIEQSVIKRYLTSTEIDFIFLFLLPFCLFRFFDIIKPWPINWLDKNVSGAIGVMLDDIVAAIFASVVQYVITFTLIEYIN